MVSRNVIRAICGQGCLPALIVVAKFDSGMIVDQVSVLNKVHGFVEN